MFICVDLVLLCSNFYISDFIFFFGFILDYQHRNVGRTSKTIVIVEIIDESIVFYNAVRVILF